MNGQESIRPEKTGAQTDESHLKETKIDSEEIFSGRIMHIQRDHVRLVDGSVTTREVLRHTGAACVIPITADGQVLMVRQWRYPVDQALLEIPAGKLDHAKEAPLDAAKRELREETGAVAGQWYDLGVFYGAPAYTDEAVHIYAAKDLTMGEQHLDQGEFLDCTSVPLEKLVQMALQGELPDGKTQLAVIKLAELRRRGIF